MTKVPAGQVRCPWEQTGFVPSVDTDKTSRDLLAKGDASMRAVILHEPALGGTDHLTSIVFDELGVAASGEASAYLDGIGHATLTDWSEDGPVYDTTAGQQPATQPVDESIWVASATGPAPTLTWNLTDGSWTVVLMNTDGSSPVAARVRVGAEVPALDTVIGFFLSLAALLLLAGGGLVVTAIRLTSRPPATRENS